MLYSISSFAPVSRRLRSENLRIVLATGFFDLLHSEHRLFLTKARAAGDILVVAVESDARARSLKGNDRPIETQSVRCEKVASFADYVIALTDDFDNQAAYASLLDSVHPAIYAVSSHTSYLDNKQKLLKEYGGRLVVVHDFNPDVSTSKILSGGNGL